MSVDMGADANAKLDGLIALAASARPGGCYRITINCESTDYLDPDDPEHTIIAPVNRIKTTAKIANAGTLDLRIKGDSVRDVDDDSAQAEMAVDLIVLGAALEQLGRQINACGMQMGDAQVPDNADDDAEDWRDE